MRKKLIVIGIVILLVFIGITVISAFQKHSAQVAERNVSDAFLNDILADKASSAYNLFSTAAQKDEPQTAWAPKVAQLSDFFLNERPQFSGTSSVGSDTTYSYSIRGLDGNYIFRVSVQRDVNAWQVQSFVSTLKQQ